MRKFSLTELGPREVQESLEELPLDNRSIRSPVTVNKPFLRLLRTLLSLYPT